MSAILKDEILPFRMDFLRALKPCKFHKQKPVREAALGTIMQLKEMDPPLEEHEIEELDENTSKRPKPSMRSPRPASSALQYGSTSAPNSSAMNPSGRKSVNEGGVSVSVLGSIR
jgi:hypothetical protein